MKLKKLDQEFSVCKVEDYSLVDLSAEYGFIGKTDEENSLVCATGDVPSNVVERAGYEIVERRQRLLLGSVFVVRLPLT